MKKSTLIIFLLAAGFILRSQTAPDWVKFSTPSNFQNHDAEDVSTGVDTLNNVYTAASAYDTLNNLYKSVLVKHNSAGVQQWIKFYDATGGNNGTYITALLVDKTGNSYACGYGRHNNTSNYDFLVMKYDNAGFQVWMQYWDGGQNQDDYVTCATFDGAGNIIVSGYSNGGGTTGKDIAVVKYGISGTKMWDYQYNYTATNGEDRALAICSNTLNDVFVTGSSYGVNARDMVTIKLNASGVNQWTNRAPRGNTGNDERGCDIVADGGGNCYVTGNTDNWTTFKYGTNGSTVWTNVYTQNGFNGYNQKSLMLDKNGDNLYTAGDAGVSGTGNDIVVIRINALTGFTFWTVTKDFGGSDYFTDMAMDTSGFVYTSGYFDGPLGTDMSVMAVSRSGLPAWFSTYNNPAFGGNKIDMPYKIAVDRSRNVILAGVSEDRTSGSDEAFDITTIKFTSLALGINVRYAETMYVHLSPNPTNGLFTITTSDNDLIGSVISVTDVTGQVILTEKINTHLQTFNLRQNAKGIYFVNLHSEKGSVTKKIVLE